MFVIRFFHPIIPLYTPEFNRLMYAENCFPSDLIFGLLKIKSKNEYIQYSSLIQKTIDMLWKNVFIDIKVPEKSKVLDLSNVKAKSLCPCQKAIIEELTLLLQKAGSKIQIKAIMCLIHEIAENKK